MFKNSAKVGLQEAGPRFTLKLKSLQHGTFDSKTGEYIWLHNVSLKQLEYTFIVYNTVLITEKTDGHKQKKISLVKLTNYNIQKINIITLLCSSVSIDDEMNSE